MGSELLEKEDAPPLSYTEQFIKVFPYYLSIGMTYDEFWNQDCLLAKYYRESQKMKDQKKNTEMWIQGMYVYEALIAVSPVLHAFAKEGTKPLEYAKKPYPLTKEQSDHDKETQEEQRKKVNRQKAKAVFETWAMQLDVPNKEVKDNAND